MCPNKCAYELTPHISSVQQCVTQFILKIYNCLWYTPNYTINCRLVLSSELIVTWNSLQCSKCTNVWSGTVGVDLICYQWTVFWFSHIKWHILSWHVPYVYCFFNVNILDKVFNSVGNNIDSISWTYTLSATWDS